MASAVGQGPVGPAGPKRVSVTSGSRVGSLMLLWAVKRLEGGASRGIAVRVRRFGRLRVRVR